MIARLTGRLAAKEPGRIVVDVQGVGYEVFIPFSTFYQLPDLGRDVSLHTFTHVRDDAIQLYGFSSLEEKALFELLGSVQGIGPRLATNILSGAPVEELVPAIADGDLGRLKAIPGVGKKMAERLVVELKDKVRQVASARAAVQPVVAEADGALGQVVSALTNLGCSRKEALRAAETARANLGPDADFERLIKQALHHISDGGRRFFRHKAYGQSRRVGDQSAAARGRPASRTEPPAHGLGRLRGAGRGEGEHADLHRGGPPPQ